MWQDAQRSARGRLWAEVERFLSELPPETFRQAKLLEYDLALRCLRGGAYDFIQKPIDRDHFVASLHRAIRARAMNRLVKDRQSALERCASELQWIVGRLQP